MSVPLEARACRGVVFNIMRFSLHDGPGVRTTVFVKGCPLACWWCHNPESQSRNPEVMFAAERCVRCGDCVRACSHGALAWNDGPVRNASLCSNCGACAEVCFADARRVAGWSTSVDELVDRLRRDAVFYEQSGGGVTFSGGEPMMQPEFLVAALTACKDLGYHTAVDTCGYASRSTLERVAEATDLFLFDLKCVDSDRHKRYTGLPNEIILENLGWLAREHKPLIARVPVIPGVNDDEANISATIELLSDMRVERVDLLAYHTTGTEKYGRLGAKYPLEGVSPCTPEKIAEFSQRFSSAGFVVRSGG